MAPITDEFRPVIENNVYLGDGVAHIGDKDLPVSRILILERFIVPTEDDILAYLRNRGEFIKKNKRYIHDDHDQCRPLTLAEKILCRIPDGTLSDILGDAQMEQKLRELIAVGNLQEGQSRRQYLAATYGLIPTRSIERLSESACYRSLLDGEDSKKAGLGRRIRIELALHPGKDGLQMMSEEDLNLLLKHGVTQSTTLKIANYGLPGNLSAGFILEIYSSFRNVVQAVPDISELVRDSIASRPLQVLQKELEDTDDGSLELR